jgi:hypothetical protein
MLKVGKKNRTKKGVALVFLGVDLFRWGYRK